MTRAGIEQSLACSSVEEPCEGKLSRTVLETSRGGDAPAEFDSGRVCVGTHPFPRDPARVPGAFFESYFSAHPSTARGKSRRHPEDIGLLWAELHRQPAFPLDDLVAQFTVADAMRLGGAEGRRW
jgi:hypothetical protein